MKKYLLIFAFALGFSQINWQIEVVDTAMGPPSEYQYQNALALDTNDIPHILFNKRNYSELILAKKIPESIIWVKEIVDSGLFYACPALVFDRHNVPHCSYYEFVEQTGYLCYAYRATNGWVKIVVDTIPGIITNRSYFHTSIDIDTFCYPKIAYLSWNPRDSLFYIKYAHYDGIQWSLSVVEYDTSCAPRLQPSDWFPKLQINSKNIPYIAYHHICGQHDTIKFAQWNDSLGKWDIESVMDEAYSCAAVDLAIDEEDIPYIAHGVDIGLYCSWRVNESWYHEYTGIGVGWLGVRLSLALDSMSNPHIFYHFVGPVAYCYKDTVWHDCGRVDSTLDNGDITLLFNKIGQPNVSFRFTDWDSATQSNYFGVKYATGTFTGIEEKNTECIGSDTELKINIYPNIVQGVLNVGYMIPVPGDVEIMVYDITGSIVGSKTLKHQRPGYYKEMINSEGLSNGIYFLMLKQHNEQVSRKFLLIK